MFFAIYQASNRSQTGCVKEFFTQGQDTVVFPPQVTYSCDLCNTTHGFQLLRTLTANGTSQQTQLRAYAKERDIETDVSLSA